MGGMATGPDNKGVLNERALETIKGIEGVGAVTPIISEYMTVIHGKRIASCEISGINADVLELSLIHI